MRRSNGRCRGFRKDLHEGGGMAPDYQKGKRRKEGHQGTGKAPGYGSARARLAAAWVRLRNCYGRKRAGLTQPEI